MALPQPLTGWIDTPSLVVHAVRDELIELDAALELYRWLPDAELAVLPGVSHMRPPFEPATFVAAVTDFVRRHCQILATTDATLQKNASVFSRSHHRLS